MTENKETRLDDWLRELLGRLKEGLERLYVSRLAGVYLFGSHARGEAVGGSDVDLLVVLDDVPDYNAEIERTSELISSLALDYGVSLSRVFLSRSSWLQGEGPFLLTVREDAIAA